MATSSTERMFADPEIQGLVVAVSENLDALIKRREMGLDPNAQRLATELTELLPVLLSHSGAFCLESLPLFGTVVFIDYRNTKQANKD